MVSDQSFQLPLQVMMILSQKLAKTIIGNGCKENAETTWGTYGTVGSATVRFTSLRRYHQAIKAYGKIFAMMRNAHSKAEVVAAAERDKGQTAVQNGVRSGDFGIIIPALMQLVTWRNFQLINGHFFSPNWINCELKRIIISLISSGYRLGRIIFCI